MTTYGVDARSGGTIYADPSPSGTFDARRSFDARGRVDLGGKVGEGGKLTAPTSK